ncbi:hypothetical protein UY3_00404 [Chelonia mydas]|uniref:Uncharacterized protein n=1 Tax=Chelonia mydas TaxID=8469 RepID=M7BWX9_CHEMY|nr:hypothetical protein UY3_00404 [Chelonia mydas]
MFLFLPTCNYPWPELTPCDHTANSTGTDGVTVVAGGAILSSAGRTVPSSTQYRQEIFSRGSSLCIPLHLPATLDLYKWHNSTGTWDHVYTFINGTSHQLLRSFRVRVSVSGGDFMVQGVHSGDGGVYRFQDLDATCLARLHLVVLAPSACPLLHRFVARGSTAVIPLRLPRGSVALCKVNAHRPRCDWVMVLIRGRLYYFLRALKGHLILHTSGLVVQEMKGDMEGEYWVLSGKNRTCLARILLTAVGPLFFYRFLLVIPGLLFMAVLVLIWDWLIKLGGDLSWSMVLGDRKLKDGTEGADPQDPARP